MARTLRRTAAFSALWRSMTSGSRGGPSLGRRLGAIPRMIRHSVAGRYDGGARLAAMAAGMVYVVSPIDFVPEALLFVVGLADDAVVVTWLAGAMLSETERFLEWERQRTMVVDGHVAVPRQPSGPQPRQPGGPQAGPKRPDATATDRRRRR